MNADTKGSRDQVTGHVKNKRINRDGTTTFTVSGKGFKSRFLLPPKSYLVGVLYNNDRVLVLSTDVGRKYPRLERLIPNPTSEQVQAGVRWTEGKQTLPE